MPAYTASHSRIYGVFAIYFTLGATHHMNSALVIFAGILAGAALGIFSGFAVSVHRASNSGDYLQSGNSLRSLFCRPSNQLNSTQTLIVFFFVIASIPVTFSLLLAPVIVSSALNYQVESVLIWAGVVELAAILFFRPLGTWFWWRIS